MAKRQRKNVTVKLGELQLSGAAGDASGLHAEIEMDLPVYAITPTGLIPGRFIRSAFMGDPCSDAHSNAEFGFNRPVESPVLGVFATAVPIDPKRANISIEKNAWFDVKAGSFVRIASYRVDLDGNDSTDLYGVHRVDSELDWDFLSNVARDAPPRIVPAAGWYGADIDFIEANVDGRWIRLSAYQLGSCT
jgi:hypothetical protein